MITKICNNICIYLFIFLFSFWIAFLWVSIVTTQIFIDLKANDIFDKGGIFTLSWALINCDPNHSLVTLCLPPNHDIHMNSKFGKIMCHNVSTTMTYHKNKRENTKFKNRYYVVGITTHSISKIWSVSQHCCQGGRPIPCYNWPHLPLHMPRLDKNTIL